MEVTVAAYLLTLGEFRLLRADGTQVQLPVRARAMLAYLAAANVPVSRTWLAGLLSPDEDEQGQRKNLRQALYVVRKALGDDAVFTTTQGDVALEDRHLESDIRKFRQAASEAESLDEAAKLYRGQFLSGERTCSPDFEDWLSSRRAELAEVARDTLLELSRKSLQAGATEMALGQARRAVAFDPLCEAAHRQVMLCFVERGDRSGALRQYQVVRRTLADELDAKPEPETDRLRSAIQEMVEPTGSGKAYAAWRSSPLATAAPGQARLRFLRLPKLWEAAVALAAMAIVTVVTNEWSRVQPSQANSLPTIAVLPFRDVDTDGLQNGLGSSISEEIIAILASHPALSVISRTRTFRLPAETSAQEASEISGARYVLDGTIRHSGDVLEVVAHLTDAQTGHLFWAKRFHAVKTSMGTIHKQIIGNIYESLIGFTGELRREQQRQAWLPSHASADEQDYVLRGEQFFFQFSKAAHAQAQRIWREGLKKYPGSTRLRMNLAFAYRHAVEAGYSDTPEKELRSACQLGQEVRLSPRKSRLEEWLAHWLAAKLAQWCDHDFVASLIEARAAADMVQFDATARADLAEIMANAGETDEAIEWLLESIERDPKPPEWYRGNLAWAYYLDGQYGSALAELQKQKKPRRSLLAAVHVRLGRLGDARSILDQLSIVDREKLLADERRRPLAEPLRRKWLGDLQMAGLP